MGSNLSSALGNRAAILDSAVRALASLPQTRLVRVSTYHTTRAVSTVVQPDFLNAVAIVETTLSPRALLDALLSIEQTHGRHPLADVGASAVPQPGVPEILPWQPRTLDLDLILMGTRIVQEEGLIVPHPRMHTRRFVLVPLAEVLPDALVPLSNYSGGPMPTVRELLALLPG